MKFIIFILILILLISSTFAIDVDSLLLKSIGGENGLQSLKKYRSMYLSGSARLGELSGKFEQMIEFPNKFYLNTRFPNFSMVQGYDGKIAWQINMNGQKSEITGHEKLSLLKSIYLSNYSYILDKEDPNSVFYIGKGHFNQIDCHIIGVIFNESDTVKLYHDAVSALRVGFESKDDFIHAKTIESDYNLYDNIPIAQHLKTIIEAAGFTIQMQIDSISFNNEFDPEIFSYKNENNTDYYFPDSENSVVIDIEYINGHIHVPVTINGMKKVWMILDSGAASNIFNQPVVEDLSLSVVGVLPAMGIGGFDKVDLLQTDSMQIGSLKLYNQVAGSMNLADLGNKNSNPNQFGGILGYDFLSRFPVMIDYDNLQLTVFDPKTFTAPKGISSVHFDLTRQIPIINATINGIEGDFIIDLGNALGLILHDHFVESSGLLKSLQNTEKNQRLMGGIGGFVAGEKAVASSFRFGDITFEDIEVLLPDSSAGITSSEKISGNVGNPVLDKFVILFDYANSTITLFNHKDN